MPCDPVNCPPRLPIDRVVRVTIDDKTRVFDHSCMEMVMLITDDAGLVDGSIPESGAYLVATSRVRVIGSLTEVGRHWDKDSETYRALEMYFIQNERPSVIKVGWIDVASGETPVDALDEIIKCDECWYLINHVHSYSDVGNTLISDNLLLDEVAEWAEANRKLFITDSRDVNMENPTDTTNICYRLGTLGMRRTAVCYHEGWCEEVIDNLGNEIGTNTVFPYLSVACAAYIANADLNEVGSGYTLKFKAFKGVRVSHKTSDAVTAVTGFIPGTGLDTQVGHFANMYVNVGGEDILVEGTTVTGHFIDIVHALDWLAAQAQQRVYQALRGIVPGNSRLFRRKIPYTERGMAVIDGVLVDLAQGAVNAGIISDDVGTEFNTYNEDGDFIGAFRIRREAVNDQPMERRSQRLAPPIELCFRVAGAIHWVDIRLCAFA